MQSDELLGAGKPRDTENVRNERRRLLRRYKNLRSKKPNFIRQESWRYKRVKINWRKPHGVDSKMRVQKKGRPKLVQVGYRSPKCIRGLHPSGYIEISVHGLQDMNGFDPKEYAVRIAHTVGLRKKLLIQERARDLGFHVLNPRRGVGL